MTSEAKFGTSDVQVRKGIVGAVKTDLDTHMNKCRLEIPTLMTDFEPAVVVKNAMNQISTKCT